MAEEKTSLDRQTMCNRLAMEFLDGWVVNLGVGMPTLCSNYDFGDTDILFQSENGVIGYGPLAPEGEEDIHLVNAGGQHVTLQLGAAITHHADSFSLIRAGYIDVTVMGAYEVAENGDFANWKTAGRKGGGIGGAMDLAVGAKQVFLALEHTTREGAPRLLKRCALPVTAVGSGHQGSHQPRPFRHHAGGLRDAGDRPWLHARGSAGRHGGDPHHLAGPEGVSGSVGGTPFDRLRANGKLDG